MTTQFSFYLQGRNFTLCTDHSFLLWHKSFHDKTSEVLVHWLYYLEPFRPYIKIEHRASIKHGNVDTLSRFETRSCPKKDCPDPGHKLPKCKFSKLEDQAILHPVLTLKQMNAKQGLDSDCAMVYLFSDEEIKDAQYGDPDHSWVLKIFH